MNLKETEAELIKRHTYPYKWGVKQNNYLDNLTNFIYDFCEFEKLLMKVESFRDQNNYDEIFNYALNRWYNFRSAHAIEYIFCGHPKVIPALNRKDKFVDFYIDGLEFDHKTTVFPKGFAKSVEYAINNKKELITWLYENQSRQQRKHFKNRLFVVLNYNSGENWKLKAEIIWLGEIINNYLDSFDKCSLTTFNFGDGIVYSDIIWGIKE